MPTPATIQRFVARVEQGAHADVIAEFYTEASSMQENEQPPRVGRDALVANERNVLARARAVRSQCIGAPLVDGDRVVIRWVFEFDWHDGTTTRIEEIAEQRWEGERIAQEKFFYDPAQRRPREVNAR
jgi:SnoaL-like domain